MREIALSTRSESRGPRGDATRRGTACRARVERGRTRRARHRGACRAQRTRVPLERSCIARCSPSEQGAAYLTPIEARLAKVLPRRGYPLSLPGRDRCIPCGLLGRRRRPRGMARRRVRRKGLPRHGRDAARDREMSASGYTVLRFTGSRIYQEPGACAAEVSRTLDVGRPAAHRRLGAFPLSTAQLAASRHRAGPARVAAPAGSGKTRVIEARIRGTRRHGSRRGTHLVQSPSRRRPSRRCEDGCQTCTTRHRSRPFTHSPGRSRRVPAASAR